MQSKTCPTTIWNLTVFPQWLLFGGGHLGGYNNSHPTSFYPSHVNQPESPSGSAMPFRGGSRWKCTLCIIPASTFALGVWQLYRYRWKQNLIKLREEGLQKPPVPLDGSLLDASTDPVKLSESMPYVPIVAKGRFIHAKELHIVPRTYRGKNGAHVVTPFETDSGTRILVNRGWIPLDKISPRTRMQGQIDGETSVVGTLRPICPKRLLMPDNNPSTNKWYWADVEAMARYTNSRPVMLDAMKTPLTPGGFPMGGHAQEPLTDNHLNYAITWFITSAMTTVTSVMFITGKKPIMAKRKWF